MEVGTPQLPAADLSVSWVAFTILGQSQSLNALSISVASILGYPVAGDGVLLVA